MRDKTGLADRAYGNMRAGLVSCVLAPGSRLNISKLRKELNVSQAALREALSRLCAEGLVVAEHNAGFRATPVLASGYRELAMACNLIEEPCLRSSIQNGDERWEQHLIKVYEEAGEVLREVVAGAEEIERYVTQRQAFHEALFSACGNRWLLSAWSLIYTQHMRYRQTFTTLARFESHLFADYSHFLEIVLARKEEEAIRLWRENHLKVIAFFEKEFETRSEIPAETSIRKGAADKSLSVA